jgi:peptide/nickel transport system permease protein
MHLARYCAFRLAQLVPVLLGITLIVFLLLRVMPGDPATLILGARGTAEDIARLKAQLGLDRPLWEQYLGFLWDILSGSLERLPATLLLVAYSTLLTVIITMPLAILAAFRKDRPADYAIKSLFVVGMSMPSFWLGVLLILLFGLKLHLFPVSGYGSDFLDRLWHLFLPALVIAVATSALTIRSLRSSILAVKDADYVDTARAKGLKPRAVVLHHILRNSLVSTVSVLGVHTSWIIGGTVVIEAVFAIPGLGYLLVSSIFTRDYPMVQGLTVTFAVLVVLISLLTDIAYALIDPRVRYD